MGAKTIVISKDGKEATIVASSFHVWEAQGWSKKEDSKTDEGAKTAPPPSPPPAKPSA